MFLNHSDEQKSQRITKAIKEISLRLERIEDEISSFYKEHNVSPQQLSHYLATPEHFSEEQWNTIQNLRKELEQRLQLDQEKAEKKSTPPQKLTVQHHWLHVR